MADSADLASVRADLLEWIGHMEQWTERSESWHSDPDAAVYEVFLMAGDFDIALYRLLGAARELEGLLTQRIVAGN